MFSSKHNGVCNNGYSGSEELEGTRNPEWQNLDQHMQTHSVALR